MWRNPVRRSALLAAAAVAIAVIVSSILAPRPQVRVTMTPFSTTVEVDRRSGDPRDRDLELVSSYATPADLAIGGDIERLTKVYKKLKASTAGSNEPARSNRLLHVGILDIPGVTAGAPARVERIALDLKNAGDAAVLLIAQGPVIWNIRNASPDQRAKIAIEGPAAFDVENAAPGLLAAFRTEAFGIANTTSPADYAASTTPERAARLCAALRRWANLFETPLSNVGLWIVKSPTEIKVQQSGLSTTDWPQPRASDAQSKCSSSNSGFFARRPQSSFGAPLSAKPLR